MGLKGMVFDIKRYAIHDGPGIRTTVFLKGCPLRCPWCHNPEGKETGAQFMWHETRCLGCRACEEACHAAAIEFSNGGPRVDGSVCDMCGECARACYPDALEIVGRDMAVDEVVREIEKDKVFYEQSGGGVTFSGGEPLMQPRFLGALLKECKKRRIHTAVDTSGYADPGVFESLMDDVDLFLYDMKIMDDDMHRKLTGVSNGPPQENLKMLLERGRPVRVRFSVIPGVNDGPDNIDRLGAFVASLADCAEVHLLPYHRAGIDKSRRLYRTGEPDVFDPPSAESLRSIGERLSGYGLYVKVGG